MLDVGYPNIINGIYYNARSFKFFLGHEIRRIVHIISDLIGCVIRECILGDLSLWQAMAILDE
jgi:uncharacterized metal-binding protein